MKILLILCYGSELLVYIRARKIWDLYVSFFPDVEVLFFKDDYNLRIGEISFDGFDYKVGVANPSTSTSQTPGYATTGIWSPSENWMLINRMVAIYSFLLRSRSDPFYCYHSTITSIVDLRVFRDLIRKLPNECFAGMPGLIKVPEEYSGLYIWGANAIVSSNILRKLCDRYDPSHPSCNLPNDVWQHYLLPDVRRMAIPLFSFLRERNQYSINAEVESLAKKMLNLGYFHFRIKTASVNNNYNRSEIDPWIMLTVARTIINSVESNSMDSIFELIERCMKPLDSNNLPMKISEDSFFSAPRILPFDDNEVHA